MDNGPEFTSKAMFVWSQRTGVELRFIQSGKPTQNAFVESFNGKFRDACLNLHWFVDIIDARRSIRGPGGFTTTRSGRTACVDTLRSTVTT